ncbi:MAG: Hsp33 family molecular chaperone HslO [Opitutae bacterium]|nr:Hsp33 family molecular chaperone HslO [Opitutae bacterium]
MSDTPPVPPADPGFEVRTFFVRSRNVLLARADFGPLFVDYFLHLSDHHMRPAPEHAALFKQALAAFVLHCASRPRNEMTAWTLHFQEPFLNIFLTGDNDTGAVAGRIFTENVKQMPGNMFYSDVVRGTQPPRRSSVVFTGGDPLAALETFYRQSEQRSARCFPLEGDVYALVSEHPDCDVAWFEQLTAAQVTGIDAAETLAPMERRAYRWLCGCNQQRMLQVLAPAFRDDAAGLFGTDEKIEIRCPRCGGRHVITREAMEAFVAQKQ